MKNKMNHFQARVFILLRRKQNNDHDKHSNKDKSNNGDTSLIG